MSVVVSIEDIGPCRKQLRIEVPAPAVDAETRRVIDELRKRTKLPGFRKGKIPGEIIVRRFREEIDQTVIDRLVPRYWRQAESESELDSLLPPQLEDVELEPGKSLTFVASVDIRPTIELGDIETFELPEIDSEPPPDEIERALEDLRREAADWDEVDRPAAQGDRVRGEIEALGEEEPQVQPFRFEVGDADIWEELSLAVTGLVAGQQGEFVRRAEGGERRFRVRLQAVEERRLPPLDAALAERFVGEPDLDRLRERVTERLRGARLERRRVERERAVTDQLRERHPVPLPSGVVDHEIEQMLRDYAEGLAARGVDPQQADIDWRQLADQVRPQAERRVHARLLLDAVASKLGLEVDESEFEATLARIARAQGRSTSALRQALDGAGRLAALRAQLRREKALRRLLGEAPPGAPAGDEVGPAENGD